MLLLMPMCLVVVSQTNSGTQDFKLTINCGSQKEETKHLSLPVLFKSLSEAGKLPQILHEDN